MIYLICGQKGTGKTLFLTSLLRKKKKQYSHIYSNFPISFMKKINHVDWVNFRFPPNSAILIDEAQLYFNSREFSKLTKSGIGMQLLDYLTMCRHYQVDIFFITQSANRIDLQIRELADYIYFLKCTYKIPFTKKPFLVRGVQFPDILEFEKYVNPNNFGNNSENRFLLKLIKRKDLKCYDTHFIEKAYFEKDLIVDVPWSDKQLLFVAQNKSTILYRILKKVKFNFKMFYIKFFKNKKNDIKKNIENEHKYF